MPRPSRLRRVLKWSGLALCLLTLLGYAASYGHTIGVFFGSIAYTWLGMTKGCLHAIIPKQFPGLSEFEFEWWELDGGPRLDLGFTFCRYPFETVILFPLWAVFLALAIPTAFLWRRDRRSRIPPGHCRKCGYNLTGNVSGICPECETPVPAAASLRPVDAAPPAAPSPPPLKTEH